MSRFAAHFLLSVAYVIGGKLGLLLALPPGYAAPIFPPAGIAITAVFIGGGRTLPWIFLGSLVLNVWVGYSASPLVNAVALASALIIAAASTLQAAIGGWALRRVIGYPAAFDNVRDIERFLLLAPVLCLTSATLSVSGLGMLGVTDLTSFATNWGSWWIGDTVGLVVMLPLVMVAAGEPRGIWKKRMRSVAIPMMLVFALFTGIFIKTNQWEQHNALVEFRLDSQQAADQIQAAFDEQVFLLEQFKGFFLHDRRVQVTRQEFHHYVQPSLTRFSMIQAVEWAPRVEASRRAGFEAMQAREWPGFAIRERDAAGGIRLAGGRPEFYPVTYLEPVAGNESAIGFDLASQSDRRAALNESIKQGRAVATAPIHLVQERGQQAGLLLLAPVTSDGHVSGVVLTVLRMNDFMDKLLAPKWGVFHARLIDLDAQKVLFDNFGADKKPESFSRNITLGARHYELQTVPTSRYVLQHRSWQSWGVLVTGLFGTGLLGALFLLSTGHTQRVEDEVRVRTRELQASEERFRLISTAAKDGIIIINAEERVIYWNPAAESIFGYPAAEVLSRAMHETIAPPRYLEDFRRGFEVFRQAGTGAVIGKTFEISALHKSGKEFPVELSITAFQMDGRWHALGLVRDVSERKKAELEYKTVIETTQDGFLVVDAHDAHILDANLAYGEMLGYGRDELLKMKLAEIERTEPNEERVARARQIQERGHAKYEARHRRRDGSLIDVDVSATFLDIRGGVFIVFVRDISPRKRLERELQELNQSLATQVREEVAKNLAQERLLIHQSRLAAMGEMIGNIAHQWRQPLNALGILLTNIRDDYEFNELDKKAMDGYVTSGRSLIQQMSSTIDDFRNFFRPNKVKQNFSLNQSLDDAIKLVRAGSRNHDFLVYPDDEKDIQVYGFPNEFSQVVLNVLNNARDAFQEKGISNGRIEIHVGRDDGRAFLAVRDNAGGIAENDLPKIFDPYFTTKEKGTGIGLYMSKMILEHMDGTIEARNVQNGAEFRITLDLSASGEEEIRKPPQ